MNSKLIAAILLLIVVAQGWLFLKIYREESIAYIDTGKLLNASTQMQALQKQLQTEREKAKANLDTLTIEFQEVLKEYEKNASKMSVKEKQLSQDLLKAKQNSMLQYQQAIEQKVLAEEQKKTQEIMSSINSRITDYGSRHSYRIILATSNGNIAYGDKGIDITEEIIKEVNGN